jgi:hypothetical protein
MKYDIRENTHLESWDILENNESADGTLVATFFDKARGFNYWKNLVGNEINNEFKEDDFEKHPIWEVGYEKKDYLGLFHAYEIFRDAVIDMIGLRYDCQFLLRADNHVLIYGCFCEGKKIIIKVVMNGNGRRYNCTVYREVKKECGESMTR